MYVQIGVPKEPSDIVDLLLECHERIRTFVGLAGRLANTKQPSVDEVRDAATRVARYFSEALPLHVADEEQSILPRLSGRDSELDEALNSMREQHRQHEEPLRVLLQTCEKLKSSPEALSTLRETLAGAASTLEKEFLIHLSEEEQIILPALRRCLTPEERAAIVSELRARRT